jgi:signal transduction histidine kinase
MAVVPGQTGDDRFTGEEAALRRVATMVAHGAPPPEVLGAVTEEAGRLLQADFATMARYSRHGTSTVVAAWSSTGTAFPAGTQARLGGRNLPTLVFQTSRAARVDDYSGSSDPLALVGREFGLRAGVGVPVRVEGRLWGVLAVGSGAEPLPAGTEERLSGFTELAATAIANAQARVDLHGFAEEQAALRRVATLVARAAPPGEVLTAVAGEAGRLLHADHATMGRYGPDGAITVVATWGVANAALAVGTQHRIGGQDLHTMIFRTRRPTRVDNPADMSGPLAEAVRGWGLRAAVGVPVSVEGRLWGVMVVESLTEQLPASTEARLAGFTELAGTAIANAEAQHALTASRARIVATADATRRRIERNLHDGAQQRLVSLALDVRAAQAIAPAGIGEQLDQFAARLDDVLSDLREIARGLHPAILADGGLQPALKTLARRSAVPVDLDIQVHRRLPEPVETAAYYTVAEALTNTAKHARATSADVGVTEKDGALLLRVRDDGRGGATFGRGSGLVGLKDRAEALGGRLEVCSPPGAGTTLDVILPLHNLAGPRLPARAADPADDAGRDLAR